MSATMDAAADPSALVHAATAPGPAASPPTAGGNFFDQFDAPAMTQPAAAASTTNFFDQFDQQPAPARDSLGGYLLPPQPPAAAPPTWGQRLDQFGRSVAQGATFGFGDEIAAAGDAATHAVLGRGSDAASYGDRYDANLAAERAKDAAIPWEIAVPGQVAGAAGTIIAGVPAVVGRAGLAAARLIPGAGAVLDAAGAGGEAAATALSKFPGGSYVAPVARIAAEGALYGGLQGFGEGEGGFDQRLQSAGTGAVAGAVLAPVVAGAGTIIGKGLSAVGRAVSEAGYGPKNALSDVGAPPIVGSNGQPIVATPGVARVAGQQIADAAMNPQAVQEALAQPQELVPGSQPTTFQATGDTGLGQKELGLRNTPGASQAFIDRANQQNAARVGAISGSVPDTASSVDLVNSLDQQQAALAAQRDAAVAQSRQGTLQGVGGAADSTPGQAGADLRGAIDQARQPVLQQADQAVQQGQQEAQGALQSIGGIVPPGSDAGTAAQQFGRQFRAALDSNAANSKTSVTGLYNAIDPDGTLAVNMVPAREAGQAIVANMPANAAPPTGEEAAIFKTVDGLPDAQSFRELSALNTRVTTAMRAARSDPAQAATYARLSELRSGMANIMQDTVERAAASDGAAVQAGQMAPEQSIMGRLAAQRSDWYAARTAQAQAGGDTGSDSGGNAGSGPTAISGSRGAAGQASGGFGNPSGSPSLSGQTQPLIANADQAAVDRINAANAGYATYKDIYGARAPGVGAVLAPGPTSGTFKLPDSQVGPAIFSRGAGAAERVQAAIRAGLTPQQIGDYAAFDLRRAAQNADGTLDPAKAATWRRQNGEAFQALSQAAPTIGRSFDTAQQQAGRLANLQQQRAALDATHPLKPGWGDAEVMQRVWQPGPKGADSVRAALAGANGLPVASSSIADYAAYSLRKAAAPDGVLDPAKYQAWAKAYDGALSARPDIKAHFDTVAKAQYVLDATAEEHAQALKDFQTSAAKHFLGGADPADTMGRLLNSATRQRDMADLARLTADDPNARAGIQRAIVDHVLSRLQGNAMAGQTGTAKLKSDQFQTFVKRAADAMSQVATPPQVEMFQKVAADLQRANQSVDGTRVASGSDTAQKAALLAGGMGSNLMAMVRAHGLTGLLTVIGLKGGPVGAFIGNKTGAAISALKAAGIRQTDDLVKEAMLNPGLARALLANLTPASKPNVGAALVAQISRLAATSGANAAVTVQKAMRQPEPTPMNSLSGTGTSTPNSNPLRDVP